MDHRAMRLAIYRAAPAWKARARNGLAMFGGVALLFLAADLSRTAFSPVSAGFMDGPDGLVVLSGIPAALAIPASAVTALASADTQRSEPLQGVLPAPAAVSSNQEAVVSEQAGITRYLAHKYRINPLAVDFLVDTSYQIGDEEGLDPSLLLAVIAVESGFNPLAQSTSGAQGLMQVMANLHSGKFDGDDKGIAVLFPISNMHAGAKVLKDCIRRGGSVKNGLRLYVGAGLQDDGGYSARVLQEQDRIFVAGHAAGQPPDAAAGVVGKPAAAHEPAIAETPRVKVATL